MENIRYVSTLTKRSRIFQEPGDYQIFVCAIDFRYQRQRQLHLAGLDSLPEVQGTALGFAISARRKAAMTWYMPIEGISLVGFSSLETPLSRGSFIVNMYCCGCLFTGKQQP